MASTSKIQNNNSFHQWFLNVWYIFFLNIAKFNIIEQINKIKYVGIDWKFGTDKLYLNTNISDVIAVPNKNTDKTCPNKI